MAALCFGAGAVLADENIAQHDLSGTWRGEATFLLPEGSTDQIHAFIFKSLGNGFYAGEHSWDIPAKNLKSHDGKQSTFTATEPFLALVVSDGTLWLVERGDTTNFHLRLVAPDRIEFVGMEGGEHPVVGRGSLTRK